MTNRYFSILTPDTAILDGHAKLKDSGSAYNGNLVMLGGGTSGSITLSTGSAIGVFYDLLAMTELPSTAELVANLGDDYCTYARGFFEALVGPDLFAGAAIPTPGSTLYDNADGTFSSTAGGHSKVGRVLDVSAAVQIAGAPSTTQQLARCYFDFTQLL